MSTTKKRLLIGVLAALVISGAWFYYFYFKSTSAAIRHAEDFLFRRMTVSQLSEQGHYRFFFVTNRLLESGDAPLEERFGTDRAETLEFGSFDASIEPSLGLGMMINPTAWFQNEEINLSEIQNFEKEQFVQNLLSFVEKSPGRSLLVVIHGFREGFDSAMRKTTFVASVLDINTPVLLFDWPGNQGSSLSGYRRARSVAEESGADLARAIEIIVREIGPDRLSLVANSMGAQVVAEAFSILYAEADLADPEKEIDHVVLTAPDVDHAEFNEQFKNELSALASDLTVYVSSNDRALLVSRIINRGKRLGESTLTTDQLDEATAVFSLLEPGSDLITLIDVTPVNRTRNFHNFSLETPEFYDDLFLRLTTDKLPLNRLIYRVQTPDGRDYWVLTRGR
jgi:esterase/lipase superfamily enzyme